MDPKLPTWLDKDFLAAALQGGETGEPRIAVTQFSAELAVTAGNNFASVVFRIRVHYERGTEEKLTSLIIKTPLVEGSVSEMLQILDLYSKEPNIYNELLPALNKLTSFQFAPKTFQTSVKDVLVLEDLKEQGFHLSDRYKQLDFPHCELVLKTLAKFHAGSVLCKRNYPELIEKVGKEVVYNDSPQLKEQLIPFLIGGLTVVSGICGQLGMGKDVEEMFSKCAETAADSMTRLCKPRATGLNVLNHGDLWTCNILFKHDQSGKVVDLRFIDFQACKYSSPVMDLIYFIWTSANEDVRDSRLQELCEIYRETLNSGLEQLGCEERLTSEELHEQFRVAKDAVLVTICTTLPVQMCEPEAHQALNSEQFSLEGMKNEHPEVFMKMYSGKYYKLLLPKLIKNIQTWMEYYK